MSMAKHSAALLVALAVPLAGCSSTSTPGESWLAPATADGKADGNQEQLQGADIPSEHVDPESYYLLSREIDVLVSSGALQGVRADLAQRVDGIVAELPRDGRLDIEELVRMETEPSYFDGLYPEEQAALPSLYTVLESPRLDPVVVAFPPFEAAEEVTEPGELEVPNAVEIGTFDEALEPALRRLQLTRDADGDPETVSLEDLVAAVDDPAGFLPEEVEALRQALAEYERMGTSSLAVQSVVPDPGLTIEAVEVGDARFTRLAETTIRERHESLSRDFGALRYGFRVRLQMERQHITWVEPADGTRIVVVGSAHDHDLGGEIRDVPDGLYLVEVWRGEDRVDATWAELPALGDGEDLVELDDACGHVLVTSAGDPLTPSLVRAEYEGIVDDFSTYAAEYVHALDPAEPTGDIDDGTVASTTPTPVPLAPGRYAIEDRGEVYHLDVFPSGALRLDDGAAQRWMTPGLFAAERAQSRGYAIEADMGRPVYFADTNRLQIGSRSHEVVDRVQ